MCSARAAVSNANCRMLNANCEKGKVSVRPKDPFRRSDFNCTRSERNVISVFPQLLSRAELSWGRAHKSTSGGWTGEHWEWVVCKSCSVICSVQHGVCLMGAADRMAGLFIPWQFKCQFWSQVIKGLKRCHTEKTLRVSLSQFIFRFLQKPISC